jgi:hypothetical protein
VVGRRPSQWLLHEIHPARHLTGNDDQRGIYEIHHRRHGAAQQLPGTSQPIQDDWIARLSQPQDVVEVANVDARQSLTQRRDDCMV